MYRSSGATIPRSLRSPDPFDPDPVQHVGRAFQIFGVILLPSALLYGLTSDDPKAVHVEILCIAVGGLAFLAGTRLLRGR